MPRFITRFFFFWIMVPILMQNSYDYKIALICRIRMNIMVKSHNNCIMAHFQTFSGLLTNSLTLRIADHYTYMILFQSVLQILIITAHRPLSHLFSNLLPQSFCGVQFCNFKLGTFINLTIRQIRLRKLRECNCYFIRARRWKEKKWKAIQ